MIPFLFSSLCLVKGLVAGSVQYNLCARIASKSTNLRDSNTHKKGMISVVISTGFFSSYHAIRIYSNLLIWGVLDLCQGWIAQERRGELGDEDGCCCHVD